MHTEFDGCIGQRDILIPTQAAFMGEIAIAEAFVSIIHQVSGGLEPQKKSGRDEKH